MNAIPTRYSGVQFRSRLESRWAAFFDLVGWRWEYEPIDLAGYIPDLILNFESGPLLVEIKPALLAIECNDACDKIIKSASEWLGYAPSDENSWTKRTRDCAVLGASPTCGTSAWSAREAFGIISDIGWSGSRWSDLQIRECDHGWTMTSFLGGWGCVRERPRDARRSECGAIGSNDGPMPRAIHSIWREAGNRVQWRAPEAHR